MVLDFRQNVITWPRLRLGFVFYTGESPRPWAMTTTYVPRLWRCKLPMTDAILYPSFFWLLRHMEHWRKTLPYTSVCMPVSRPVHSCTYACTCTHMHKHLALLLCPVLWPVHSFTIDYILICYLYPYRIHMHTCSKITSFFNIPCLRVR